MWSAKDDRTGALTRFHELSLLGKPPDITGFCREYPDDQNLPRRLQALARLQAEVNSMVCVAPQAMDRVPATLGAFRILRPLGEGGMARVFVAEEQSPRRLCAIKLLDLGSAVSLDRFRREADLAARLSHPGIAAVYRFGVEQGLAFLATELVHGFSLRDLMKVAGQAVPITRPSRSQRPWLLHALLQVNEVATARDSVTAQDGLSEVLDIAVQAAEALGHAHERGVVHRDIKPSNIMVTLQHQVKLIDFGIAVPLEDHGDRMTQEGAFLGSPHYAAGEQLRGQHEKVGPWTDTYALAAMLFEMLTRRTPFAGRSFSDRLAAADAPPPFGPRHFNSAIPVPLDDLVRRALDPNPAQRFPDGAALAAALTQVAAEARTVGVAARRHPSTTT